MATINRSDSLSELGISVFFTVIFSATALAQTGGMNGAQVPVAQAQVQAAKGATLKGTVRFTPSGERTKVTAEFQNLKPGSVHGFHIHEAGKCDQPDFKSAGGHFNPRQKPHAGPAAENKHIGDLGNVVATKDGTAKTELVLDDIELSGANSVVGKAVILHEKPDDLATQPTGNAGGRIGCGVIQVAEGATGTTSKQ